MRSRAYGTIDIEISMIRVGDNAFQLLTFPGDEDKVFEFPAIGDTLTFTFPLHFNMESENTDNADG